MAISASLLGTQRTDLLQYVGRQVRDLPLSEDIVQESYVRFLAFEAKPDSCVINMPALLRRISLNLIRDHFRQAGRIPLVELSDMLACPLPATDRQLERKQLIELVGEFIQAMPCLRREVFIRRRVHGQSAGEVAEALQLSPSAVSNHVVRAMVDLDCAIEKIEKRGGSVRD